MKTKKAQELPINVLVMIIIGIFIFGLGFALFNKFFTSGEDEIERLNEKIKTNMLELQCTGEDWLCAPNYPIKNGKKNTYLIYIVNKDDSSADFELDMIDSSPITVTNNCGSIELSYLENHQVNIQSGSGAQIPFIVNANKVQPPCTFVHLVNLKDGSGTTIDNTTLIIRVEK